MPRHRSRSWERAFNAIGRPIKRLLHISTPTNDWVRECLEASPSAAHDERIEEYFKEKAASGAQEIKLEPVQSVFICFTQRSGSTRLGELLASTGKLPASKGDFSWRGVRNRSKKRGIRSLEEYCGYLIKTQSEHGTFVCKTSAPQLALLTKKKLIPSAFAGPRFIHLRRRDLLGQAISFVIATQTGQWSTRKGQAVSEPQYNPKVIANRMRSITLANAWFQEYFAILGFPVFELAYEDLIADETGTVSAITEWLGLGPSQINLEKTNLQPQRNALNAEWRKKFLSESRQYFGADGANLLNATSKP